MRYSTGFIYTQKEPIRGAESISHDLALRAGLVQQVAAGHYDFLPMGAKVLRKIEGIVREEMNRSGALEVIMPIMQPAALWKESNRWGEYGQEMFTLKNRNDREFCLGPTHEELVVDLVRAKLRTYKELPFTLYQFGTKFRDEARPRGGLLRCREFSMKDAYSFDVDEKGLDQSYQRMRETYLKILQRTGVSAIPTIAATGEMGGKFSEEFMAPSSAGEDEFIVMDDGRALKLDLAGNVDPQKVQKGIEICHIFKLGTRYTSAMGLNFVDSLGQSRTAIMGCYGIGISRMIATIIEQNHDQKGILWPKEVAPFQAAIVPIRYDEEPVRSSSNVLYNLLMGAGIDVLLDDRECSAGVKFKDADLLGIPWKVVVSKNNPNGFECEDHFGNKRKELSLGGLVELLK